MLGGIEMDPHRLRAALAVAVVVVLTAAIPASATPTAVTFHLVGTHPPDADYHQGIFTAPSPLCPSGTWQGNGQGSRVFTCADGSGTFTANFSGEVEHTAGASGPWPITAGTGTYGALRGTGRATIDSSTGPNGNRSPSPTPGEGSSTSTTSRQRSRCAGRRQRDLGRGAATCSVSRSHVPTTWPGTTSPTPCSSARLRRIWPSARERRPQSQASRSGFGRHEARFVSVDITGDGSGRQPADNRTARPASQTPELTS